MENITTPEAPTMPEAPIMNGPKSVAPHQTSSGPSQLKIKGRVNFPATQLFEATGFIDESKDFPTANAFLMFVPGVPDQSKQSGRTYNQAAREIMKINIRDLYGLAEALNFAAIYGQCDFSIFTDSSKFAGTAQGQGQTKQVSVGTAMGNNGKLRIFLNFQGSKKITLALEKWHAVGLAGQLKTLADETLRSKFEIDRQYAKTT